MTELLVSDFLTGFMIFIRIVAMLTIVPFYNSNSIPALVRLAIALVLTYIILPHWIQNLLDQSGPGPRMRSGK